MVKIIFVIIIGAISAMAANIIIYYIQNKELILSFIVYIFNETHTFEFLIPVIAYFVLIPTLHLMKNIYDKLSYKRNIHVTYSSSRIDSIEQEISKIHNTLQNINSRNQIDIDAVIADMKEHFIRTSAQEVLSEITNKQKANSRTEGINNIFEGSCTRIIGECNNLGSRGLFNLSIGIMLALVGVYFLSNGIPTAENIKTSGLTAQDYLLVTFIPRFSLVLLIELLSFFFLRLYKMSHDHIKLYQDELTELEYKHTALLTALESGDKNTVNEMITRLTVMEHKRILKKDETTIELEKARLEKENHDAIFNKVSDIVAKVIPITGRRQE